MLAARQEGVNGAGASRLGWPVTRVLAAPEAVGKSRGQEQPAPTDAPRSLPACGLLCTRDGPEER